MSHWPVSGGMPQSELQALVKLGHIREFRIHQTDDGTFWIGATDQRDNVLFLATKRGDGAPRSFKRLDVAFALLNEQQGWDEPILLVPHKPTSP